MRDSLFIGRTTCSFFLPDNERVLYASTHLGDPHCPLSPCQNQTWLQSDATLRDLCNSTYIWDIFADYDIFIANASGVIDTRLTDTPGYDAEGTISPNGDLIVFTSIRSGDLELWTMKLDGSDPKQVTNALGYDGGAFFSPDGKKLVFRASRPSGTDADKYKVSSHLWRFEKLQLAFLGTAKLQLGLADEHGTVHSQCRRLRYEADNQPRLGQLGSFLPSERAENHIQL